MKTVEEKAIATIRVLAAEMIQKANSGHPGMAIDAAPMAYTIWKNMRHNPKNPSWQGRDRFVLSSGHASALEYSLLHLFGYGLTIEDLKGFRQFGTKTPGHPEYRHVPGVEMSSGPLGQGFATGVGMAVAEEHLASIFNRPGYPVVDNYTYVLCGDGCMMEGTVSEAASFAGTQKLSKLIVFYDRNQITIEGSTDIAFTEDVGARFAAYGWQVIEVSDGEDMEAITHAMEMAKQDTERPSLIIVRTQIGYGTPKAGTPAAHGEPLGEENIRAMKEFFEWEPEEEFTVPADVRGLFAGMQPEFEAMEEGYNRMFAEYRSHYPDLAKQWDEWHSEEIPEALRDVLIDWRADKPKATRALSGEIINKIAEYLPNLFGGSADLAPSNKTEMKGRGFFAPEDRAGSNVHFGIRELAMACMSNGIALYGGLRPYCATFMVFSDYLKPALRLTAIMDLPVLFVLTHDSIGVGEDGPTHEPIEQIASLRATPGVLVFRPADAKETAICYLAALENRQPAAMALTRQNLPQLDGTGADALRGGYVVRNSFEETPDLILMASGSEVSICCEAADMLEEEGTSVRVVSIPCMELFDCQDPEYREQVLPSSVRARIAVEAGASISWGKYVGLDGTSICIDRFGQSGKYAELFKAYGFTPEHIAEEARKLLSR